MKSIILLLRWNLKGAITITKIMIIAMGLIHFNLLTKFTFKSHFYFTSYFFLFLSFSKSEPFTTKFKSKLTDISYRVFLHTQKNFPKQKETKELCFVSFKKSDHEIFQFSLFFHMHSIIF